ncbi:MAG: GAF domain-containing protein [Spirochaetaceae bacterium]
MMYAQDANEQRLIAEVLKARRILMSEQGTSPDVTEAFGTVGKALRVDRVYFFEVHFDEHSTVLASQRYEWCAPGIEAQIDNPDLQDIPLLDAGYTRWIDHFHAYLPVHGPVSSFPEAEQAMLESQGIQSLLILPVFTRGSLHGFVGFDDCRFQRTWSDHDLTALFTLALTLGWIHKERAPSKADRAVSEAISFIDRMMNVQAVALDASPVSSHTGRTAARLAAATEIHRLLAETAMEGRIESYDLLQRLEPHFMRVLRQSGAEGGGITLSVSDATVDVSDAVSITLIATEVVSACASGGFVFGDHRVSLELERVTEALEFRIRAHAARLDAMALMALRSLTEDIGGNRLSAADPDTLVLIRFPHRHAPDTL